ncbi:protein lethal(2)essential for life-like [Nylanderia fulva]|uniref:protein lethal(2)essential for life-like n=1 Tax=Nylanderia fulva TaxID=613905 RepID=UPI0010FB2A34|nr:protein lethal(2)essential for life-like [Nylanderia fulva]
MALVSRDIYRNWWEDIDRYHREIESHFRHLSLTKHDDLWPSPFLSFRNRFRSWREIFDDLDRQVGGGATVVRDEDKYQVTVNVQQFRPEEITVRTDDRIITVEGRYSNDKRDWYGYVSRQFVRRYVLPSRYDICRVKPSLSSDGILTITAPRLELPTPGMKIIPIMRTFRPAIKAA